MVQILKVVGIVVVMMLSLVGSLPVPDEEMNNLKDHITSTEPKEQKVSSYFLTRTIS